MLEKMNKRSPVSGLELSSLIEAAAKRQLILFVGGGISRNLGLPDFRKLVKYIASQMGVRVSRLGVSDYAVIAEAYLVKNGKLGALRSWMDTTWHPSNIQIEKSQLHNSIVDLDFPIIYTTNYDRWLEKAFEKRGKPFHKIANMADLATAPDDQTHIIKFHGDFEDDESLVLTEASYFQRMIFESPLDIRLRSDCLARPILFVGYSLQDVNTRYLLFRLQELWRTSAFADQRPLSYIVMTERNAPQEIVLKSRGVHPIILEGTSPGKATTAFLRQLSMGVRNYKAKQRA